MVEKRLFISFMGFAMGTVSNITSRKKMQVALPE